MTQSTDTAKMAGLIRGCRRPGTGTTYDDTIALGLIESYTADTYRTDAQILADIRAIVAAVAELRAELAAELDATIRAVGGR